MAVTAVPAAPTLPTPPSTASPSDFDYRADTFLTALAGAFLTQLMAVITNAHDNAADAYSTSTASAASASAAATSATAASNSAAIAQSVSGATQWASGSYATGAVVWSPTDGQLYRRKSPGGSTSTDPVSDPTNWYSLSARITAPVFVVGVNTTVPTGTRFAKYVLTADSLTLTLPATPTQGDVISVSVDTGSVSVACVVGRNSSNIESTAENMTLNVPNASVTLTYTDATRGWIILS